MQELIENIYHKNHFLCNSGALASYIPELAKADPKAFGICLDDGNNSYVAGDVDVKFSIQSISKIIALMLALQDRNEKEIFERVGVEPSGDAFNSINKLETRDKKPFNPMINAGAIVISSLIAGSSELEKFHRFLDFFKKISECDEIYLDEAIYRSENLTGNKNRAMAYFLQNDHLLGCDAEMALGVYFRQCSVVCDARVLAKLGLFLARDGRLSSGEQVVSKQIIRIIKGLMITCGTYDLSGEVAIKVGLPCKSGVGGGLVACSKNGYGIGIYSPALDSKGNSLAGIAALIDLSQQLDLSIF